MKSILAISLLSAFAAAQESSGLPIAALTAKKPTNPSKAAAAAAEENKKFMEFASQNNKQYKDTQEFGKRKGNWRNAGEKVKALNKTGGRAEFNINYTADLDDSEYATLLGLKPIDSSTGRNLNDMTLDANEDRGRKLQTTDIDWANSGHMHPVKNQGGCGSCWAFAALGALEAMVAIKNSAAAGSLVPPVRLSEQQSVDCTTNTPDNVAKFSTSYGSSGCNGGWMTNSWSFSRDQGAMTNADYPYTGSATQLCMHDSTKIAARASTWGQVSFSGAVAQLQKGPLAVALSAGNNVFRYYSSGTLTSANLCPTAVDHGVLLVGYGTELVTTTIPGTTTTTCRAATSTERKRRVCADGSVYNALKLQCCTTKTTATTTTNTQAAFWRIQNSWGTGYGAQGFIKLAYEANLGVCGVNQYMLYVDAQ